MRSGEGVACSDTIGRCGVALGPVRDAGQAKLDFNTALSKKKVAESVLLYEAKLPRRQLRCFMFAKALSWSLVSRCSSLPTTRRADEVLSQTMHRWSGFGSVSCAGVSVSVVDIVHSADKHSHINWIAGTNLRRPRLGAEQKSTKIIRHFKGGKTRRNHWKRKWK